MSYKVSSRRICAPQFERVGEKQKKRRRRKERRGGEGKEEPYNGQFEFGKHFQIGQQHRGASLICKPRPAASLALCLNIQHGLKRSSCAEALLFTLPKPARPPTLPMSRHDLRRCHASTLSLHLGYFCLQVHVKIHKMSFCIAIYALEIIRNWFYFY